jgi:hypothetical protein
MSVSPDALALRPDFWPLLTLPLLLAASGWLVNRILLLFIFGPLPVKGLWQRGVLAAHAAAVAHEVGAQLSRHLHMGELFRLMEPEKIAVHLEESVEERLEEYVDGIMSERHAVLWDNLPYILRQRIYARVRRQLPVMLDGMIDEMAENTDAIIDVRSMVEEVLVREPALLSLMFADVFRAEQSFLLRTGAWLGFVSGLLLALLWSLHPHQPLLPIMVMMVIILCAWAPRELLLRARLPLVGRGWLYRRHSAVASSLAEWLAAEVLSLRNLMRLLLTGSRAGRTRGMIKRQLRPLLDAGMVRTTIQLLLGTQGYADIKQLTLEHTVGLTIVSLSDAGFSHERSAEVKAACLARLSHMTPADMEHVLRPVLQHQWWTQLLLAVGVGLCMGLVQYLWLSGG